MSRLRGARCPAHPALHLALLAGLSVWQLAVSWRRWADPIVDFGRELYIPWRLSEDAVLYRDVEDFYGPLSHYLNAILFRVFGPGMMVLVIANLAIFAAIVTLLYFLVRRAWGAGAALAGGLVFVAVFGFSQFLDVENFNYATPYAHVLPNCSFSSACNVAESRVFLRTTLLRTTRSRRRASPSDSAHVRNAYFLFCGSRPSELCGRIRARLSKPRSRGADRVA